jgi:predicted enzyme related to lactoylglutathione lyase
MYQDASNAKLPNARINLGLGNLATQNAPASPGDNGWLAGWGSGGSLDSIYSSVTGGNLIGTVSPPGAAGFVGVWGNPLLDVGGTGQMNAAVFSLDQNLTTPTLAFPSALTGYGKLEASSAGNTVFGVYGLGELYAATGTPIAAEFTARNFAGNSNVDNNLPPDSTIPTSTKNAKGVNITCGGNSITGGGGDCSVGLHIANEKGDPAYPTFTNGAYIQLYRRYGLFIESQAAGNQTGAVVKTNGNGIGMQLQSTAEPVPTNAMITMINHMGASTFYVDYQGDVVAAGGATFTGIHSVGGGGGLYVCVDSLGAFYKKAACP